MITHSLHVNWYPLLLTTVLFAAAPAVILLRRYLAIAFSDAVGLFLLGSLAGTAVIAANIEQQTMGLRLARNEFLGFVIVASMFVFTLCLGTFLIKLYRKWIGGKVTEEENLPGIEGVRAWIRGGNLVCALLIATTAWRGFGHSFFGVLLLCLAALVAYPLLRNLGSQPASLPATAAPPASDPSLSNERDRVLRMLESGAIQPDEGAELLSALGESVPAGAATAAARPPLGVGQRLALAGAVLAFIGFVLPWFSFNLGRELQHAADQLGNQITLPEMPAEIAGSLQNLTGSIRSPSMRVTGAEVGNGLGWIILFMAAGIALLSTVPSLAEPSSRRLLSVGAFLLGAALLVYLSFNGFRSISLGFPVVISGYVCLALSLFRNPEASSPAPAGEPLTK